MKCARSRGGHGQNLASSHCTSSLVCIQTMKHMHDIFDLADTRFQHEGGEMLTHIEGLCMHHTGCEEANNALHCIILSTCIQQGTCSVPVQGKKAAPGASGLAGWQRRPLRPLAAACATGRRRHASPPPLLRQPCLTPQAPVPGCLLLLQEAPPQSPVGPWPPLQAAAHLWLGLAEMNQRWAVRCYLPLLLYQSRPALRQSQQSGPVAPLQLLYCLVPLRKQDMLCRRQRCQAGCGRPPGNVHPALPQGLPQDPDEAVRGPVLPCQSQ